MADLVLVQFQTDLAELKKQFDEVKSKVVDIEVAAGKAGKGISKGLGAMPGVPKASQDLTGLSRSISQVARELPSLQIGFQTFALAISNNLPMVFDELTRTKNAIKALKDEGKEAPSVLSQVGKALFSWQTALSVGITLFTLFAGKLAEVIGGFLGFGKAVGKSAEELKKEKEETQKNIDVKRELKKAIDDLIDQQNLQSGSITKSQADRNKIIRESDAEFLKRSEDFHKQIKEMDDNASKNGLLGTVVYRNERQKKIQEFNNLELERDEFQKQQLLLNQQNANKEQLAELEKQKEIEFANQKLKNELIVGEIDRLIAEENLRYEQQKFNAKETGESIELIERVHQKNLADILQKANEKEIEDTKRQNDELKKLREERQKFLQSKESLQGAVDAANAEIEIANSALIKQQISFSEYWAWRKKKYEEDTKAVKETEDERTRIFEEENLKRAEIERAANDLQVQFGETAVEIFLNQERAITESQLAELEQRRANKTITDEEYDRARREILTRQFRADRQAALSKIAIDAAAAIVNALKTDPTGSLAIIIGAAAALQATKVLSQPEPKFHTGKIDITEKNKNSKGEFSATLLEHESVIAVNPTKKYRKELEAINSMKFEDLVYSKYIVPALLEQKKSFEKEKSESFAGNLAKSLIVNAKMNDGNIIEMLKRLNSSTKESANKIAKSLKNRTRHYRGYA